MQAKLVASFNRRINGLISNGFTNLSHDSKTIIFSDTATTCIGYLCHDGWDVTMTEDGLAAVRAALAGVSSPEKAAQVVAAKFGLAISNEDLECLMSAPVTDGSLPVHYYEIVIKHDDEGNLAGYIQFESCGTVHRSNIYSIPELNGILVAWRHNELKGSFAAGYSLAKDHGFQLVQEGV